MIIPENNNAQNTHEQPNHDEEIQNNRFTIEIQDDGNLIVKDKNGVTTQIANIRGPRGPKGLEGVQGPNGNDGQDGDSWIPSITEDGTSLIFVDNDGNRRGPYRIKGDSGERGAQGATGPKGQDADLWKPAITEDGKYLFFENQKGEHTEKYLIQGIKGDTGGEGPRGPEGPSGPVFIPSVNVDGEISWSNNGNLPNPAPINIRGSKGDTGENGAVFHPVIIDGYLTWTNDRGLPNPAPVKISGPQGITGEKGNDGRSAYQIWLDNGNLGTEKEFLESLKGEKGDAAEQISTGYLDVKDYHCPVQMIDTDLITSSGIVAESPEDIVEKRTEEIKELRREGHTPEMRKQMNVGWFKKMMWWCAGADKDLLTMCPGDHSKYVGIGTVILFTALMAFFSSFIAMRLVLGVADQNLLNWGSLGALVFALFWGAMIFFLDRFITNTMYSDGKVTISKQEFICGLPRIIISIFLGIVISAPLELKIFESKIQMEMKSQQREERKEKEEGARAIAEKNFNSELKKLNDKLVAFESQMESVQSMEDKLRDSRPLDNNQTDHGSFKGEDGEYYPYTRTKNLNADNQKKWDEKNDETLKKYQAIIQEAIDSINSLNKQRSKLENKRNVVVEEEINDIVEQYDNNFDKGLSRQLSTLHGIALNGREIDFNWWFGQKELCWKSTRQIFLSILNCILSPIEFVIWLLIYISTFLFTSAIGLIMLLFILIDISPVLYKMMLADGKYDNYLHQEKLLAQDKIRLSLSKMLKKLDDSELKRVAPFIMGDIYEKMAGDSYVFKTEEEFKLELKNYESVSRWKRLWPISWFYKDRKPTAPVIILNPKAPSEQEVRINDVNKEVFEEVLDMKRRIIVASYRRWYKRQHDNILGDRVDDTNAGREAFEETRDTENV